MSDKVASKDIERIVGVKRHATEHWARAVSAEQIVYILHSAECKAHYSDLRRCLYSRVLDLGIDVDEWAEDEPVAICIWDGRLVPDKGTT